ncbi:non-canonical purine NTP pyrophosphatase [Singulisphaera sp. PoT]|uniref:non-canonical purine NTP pyrophosphatase n=1 Tax=Singulisphaera sp. PoT TaxID=3411797 RepID=UPI003BF5A1C8
MNDPASTITLIVGTRNRKKGIELLELLNPEWDPNPRLSKLGLQTLADYPEVPDVVEDADSFGGNARKKASETAVRLKMWTLADDSGLSVDALGGAPGIFSARYAGTHGDDDANNQKLLAELASVPEEKRGAAFICHLALSDPEGNIRLESQGACRGRITSGIQGSHGFGYDPLFLIREYHTTFGELSPLVKHQLSHRARAVAGLRAGLERLVVLGELK